MSEQSEKIFTPFFIGFCVVLVSIMLVVLFIVMSYYEQQGYGNALFDLQKVDSCSGVLLFNSNLNQYDLNNDDYKHIKNTIQQKLELLKCP